MNTWEILNQLRHGKVYRQQANKTGRSWWGRVDGPEVPETDLLTTVAIGYAAFGTGLNEVYMTAAGEAYWLENAPENMVGACECPCHIEPRVTRLYPVRMERAGSKLALVCGVCRVALLEGDRRVQ